MEEAAQKIVAHLYEHCLDESNQPSCALIRLFMTLSFGQLPTDLRALAAEALGRANPSAETQCLVLLGTRGEAPEWNQRQQSRGHQVIPLPDEASIARIPMISGLFRQFGVELGQVAALNRELLVDLENKEFNVFHVPVAKDSPYIPAQKEFVKPMGVRSVLGCGGVLPEGGLFALIVFSKADIPRDTAELFRSLPLSIKLGLLPLVRRNIFATS